MKLIILIVIALSLAVTGCINTTNEETIIDIDTYENGLHLTGISVYNGEKFVSSNVNVDGYWDGSHVTGTMSKNGAGVKCVDLYVKVDTYHTDGYHVVGYKTLKGCGDDVEWYNCLTATKDGYTTQYMNGYDDAKWRT